MWLNLKYELTRFWREEDASMIAEGVIALPTLAWWYVGSLVFFQAYEARNINIKAAYTISDMISREDGAVNANYIEGLDNVFTYMTSGEGTDQAIRVSSLYCSTNCDQTDATRTLKMDWSYGTGGKGVLVEADMATYAQYVPLMTQGDRVVMVETFSTYSAPFNVGLSDKDFTNIVVTRPRFVPVICFTGTNCNG